MNKGTFNLVSVSLVAQLITLFLFFKEQERQVVLYDKYMIHDGGSYILIICFGLVLITAIISIIVLVKLKKQK